jgi:hypothetical protein
VSDVRLPVVRAPWEWRHDDLQGCWHLGCVSGGMFTPTGFVTDEFLDDARDDAREAALRQLVEGAEGGAG